MSDKDVRLGSWQAVSLVAGREIKTKMRSKAFIITTVATLVLLVGFALVMKSISGGSDATVGSATGIAATSSTSANSSVSNSGSCRISAATIITATSATASTMR